MNPFEKGKFCSGQEPNASIWTLVIGAVPSTKNKEKRIVFILGNQKDSTIRRKTRPGDMVGARPNWVTFWSKFGLF